MKILILAMKYFPASGGTATYAHNLARGLAEIGHEVLLVAPFYKRDYSDEGKPYRVLRLSQAQLGLGQFRIFWTANNIKKIIQDFRPDVVWASTYAGCRVLGLLDINPIQIGTIHGGGIQRAFTSWNPLKRYTDHAGWKFMRRASAMITVSQEAKKLVTASIKDDVITSKFQVVYNGIEFEPERTVIKQDALERQPELAQRKIILTVGRLVKAKGHDVVIRALSEIKKVYPNILYVIAGEGVEKESLQALAQSLSLDDHVHFAGYVDAVRLEEWYALCDIFVLAGRWTSSFVEGFGLVLIEAAIRGKPVIGTRIGGIPEAIHDGVSGIVIEPENTGALVQAVLTLFQDKVLYERMSVEGPKWVQTHFTQQTMAKQNDRLLRQLTGKS